MAKTDTIARIPIPWPEDEPTMPAVDTGKAFGMERTASYESIHRGDFPVTVIRCGGKLRCATAEVRRTLGLPTERPKVGEGEAA